MHCELYQADGMHCTVIPKIDQEHTMTMVISQSQSTSTRMVIFTQFHNSGNKADKTH